MTSFLANNLKYALAYREDVHGSENQSDSEGLSHFGSKLKRKTRRFDRSARGLGHVWWGYGLAQKGGRVGGRLQGCGNPGHGSWMGCAVLCVGLP